MVKMVKCMSAVIAFAVPLFAQANSKGAFEAVPKQALVELKATIGKPFSAGLVFIDGKFIEPPYKVERYGTAFRVNGHQVTNQVVPWDEFLKTQAGVRVDKVEIPASDDAAPAAVEPGEEESSGDFEDDFDDLFDDTPKPKKKKAARPARRTAPSAPKTKSTVVFEGDFRHNARTKKMLARLNKMRTNLEIALRNGGACFFGTRYSTVRADPAPADMFLDAIPAVMKNSSSFEEFSSDARAKGISFLSEDIMRDLYRNKLDYIKLKERAKAVKEERKWANMLRSADL